jgi:hypothetical protein
MGSKLTFHTTPIGSTTDVERMVIKNNGNVGIGTTTPSSTLDVRKDASGYVGAFYNTSATGEGVVIRGGETSSQNSLVVQNYDGNRAILIARSDGNVGIGTTTPSSLLDVRKNASGYVGTFYNTSATGEGIAIRGGDTSSQNSLVVQNYDCNRAILIARSDGNVGIGTTTPSYNLDVSGTANITGNLSVDNDTLFVDASNNRVGVGTTNPSFTLSLGGDSARTIGMNESTLGTAPSLTLKSADGPTIGTNNEGGALYLSAGLGTGNASTSTIIFSNATPVSSGGTRQTLTEKMRITSNGNVGIGTTSIAVNEKLRVAGDVGANSPSVAFTSANPNVSVPNGVATTIYSFPTQPRIVFYEVFVRPDTGSNPVQYAAMTTIAVSASGIKQMSVVNGPLLVLTLAGNDLQVTQNSGIIQNIMTSVRQIFASSGF